MATKDESYNLDLEIEEALADINAGLNGAAFTSSMFDALGCPYFVRIHDSSTVVVPALREDHAKMRGYIYRLLTEPPVGLLGTHTLAALLAGFNKYGGWQKMTQTEDGTYRMAYAILYLAEWNTGNEFDQTVEPDILAIMNAWLTPAVSWTSWPTVSEIGRNLLGDAWCEVVLPSIQEGLASVHVITERPALNQKLLFARCEPGLTLPAIE